MRLPESFTTVTRTTKIIALILFISLPFIGFCLGQKYQRVQNQIKIMESLNFPDLPTNEQKISTDEKILNPTIENCKIYINLVSGEKILGGDLYGSGMISQGSPKCVQKIDYTVSPSGKYLAFTDITGGIDSVVRIYSLERQDITDLYVYGTSIINDLVFLVGDVLAVMNSFPGNYDEQWLSVYDVPSLYKDYEKITDYNMFMISKEYEKDLALPNYGMNYTGLRVSTEALIAQTEDPSTTIVFSRKKYSFKKITDIELKTDLMKRPELIPHEGVLGGTMGFYHSEEIEILSDEWVIAGFNDGHIGGKMLLQYSVSDEGKVTWTVIESSLNY